MVGLIPHGSRVLDVGCATGYLGMMLAGKRCTVVGIEGQTVAAEAARLTGAYRAVHQMDLDDSAACLPDGIFDVVLCADVLEHLRDPQVTLARLSHLLADDGLLVVSLPNVAHVSVRMALLAGRFRYTDRGILDRTHLHLFTYDSAQDLLKSVGFQVVSVLAGSDRFGKALSYGFRPVRRLRTLLAYNIVLVARRGTPSVVSQPNPQ